MAYEMREGSGSLFVNDRKRKDTHPDMQGKVMVNGEVRWVSAWKRKTKSGDDWISFAVGDVVGQSQHDQAKANGYQPQGKGLGDLDSDIPF